MGGGIGRAAVLGGAVLRGIITVHVLGPAHTTPRGVGLMAWAIRRSVFSSHA